MPPAPRLAGSGGDGGDGRGGGSDYHRRPAALPIAPNLVKFKAAPMSGFFLMHTNVEGKAVYTAEMQNIFKLSNASVNGKCNTAKEGAEWQCIFANWSYAFSQVPTFVMNSALDSWQTECIFTAELPAGFPNQTSGGNGECGAAAGSSVPDGVPGPWDKCASDLAQCKSAQLGVMNSFAEDFQKALNTTPTYTHQTNGAFIHLCHLHCEAQQDPWWNQIAVAGISMEQAMVDWWSDNQTSSFHHVTACELSKTRPYTPCNPTCEHVA